MPKKYNNKKGFTLIEILVVVIIVGILASILVPTYQKYILKSRAAEALNLLEMVKTRQQVALAKSPTKTYIPNAAELAPLTAGSTETAQGVDLLVNTDYTVTLNSSSQCAIVIYKQGTAEEFTFAASYERPGVACVGSVCNSFTSVTTNDIDSVCVLETTQQVAPPPGPVCEKTCPDFAPLNADICACVCTNTGTLMDELTQSCPDPSCQDDFTGCPPDKVLTPIPTNLCQCACPPTKPIEGENDTCLDCNDACPTNMSFHWSYDRRRCETSCPTNTILDPNSSPSNPQCISCAQATGGASPRWVADATIVPSETSGLCVVSNGGHCEPCPEDKPIWDGETCISCAELHAYAESRTSGVSSGGTTTGYTYTEIAAYQIKEQATSASPKSGGTKSGGTKSGDTKSGDDKSLGGEEKSEGGDKSTESGDKAKEEVNKVMASKAEAAAAAVKSPSSGSSSVYDNLINIYGSGRFWNASIQQCQECWEVDITKPEWNGTECVPCIEAHPARVKCSAANTSSNNGGSSGGGNSYYGGNHEYMQMGVSLPTRFNDYMTDFRANLDKYALDSGALLAVQTGVGWIDPVDGHELTLEEANHMIQACNGCYCGRGNTCNTCYGTHVTNPTPPSIPTCQSDSDVDVSTCHASCAACIFYDNDDFVGDGGICGMHGVLNEYAGALGWCTCKKVLGEYEWQCNNGQGTELQQHNAGSPLAFRCHCIEEGGSMGTVYHVSNEYSCQILNFTKGGNSTTTVTYDPQPSCSDSWHGATEYVPAKPIWNNTTHQCVACPQPAASCESNGTEVHWKLTGGSYWDGGNTCVSIGNNVATIGGYTTPKCYRSDSGTVVNYLRCYGTSTNMCTATYYFKTAADLQSYAAYGTDHQQNVGQLVSFGNYVCLSDYNGTPLGCAKSGVDSYITTVYGFLTNQQVATVDMYEPRTKAFYAVTKLGLAPVESIYNHPGYVIEE